MSLSWCTWRCKCYCHSSQVRTNAYFGIVSIVITNERLMPPIPFPRRLTPGIAPIRVSSTTASLSIPLVTLQRLHTGVSIPTPSTPSPRLVSTGRASFRKSPVKVWTTLYSMAKISTACTTTCSDSYPTTSMKRQRGVSQTMSLPVKSPAC